MKPVVLLSLILFLFGLSGQFILADDNNSNNKNSMTYAQNQTSSWLGVWIENIPISLGNHLLSILKKNQGILVKKVSPNSPADKAGLQPYDIIAKINDQEIYSQQQFKQLIQTSLPASKIELSIVRQGKLMSQEVKLEALPTKASASIVPDSHFYHTFPRLDSLRKFPEPWLNDPFFNYDFNKDMNRRLHQEMSQLRQQMGQLHQQMNLRGSNNTWSQFQSVQIESTGNDKHRAEVKYQDSEGIKKEFVFEGNLNEIRQQILVQENMDEDKKKSLLQALDMNTSDSLPFRQDHFSYPQWFN